MAAEPENESAWLWLAKVSDSQPAQKQTALETILALNPANQWAQESLATMVAETAAELADAEAVDQAIAPDALADQTSELSLEHLRCPQCDAPIELRLGMAAKMVACGHCDSLVQLTDEQFEVVGAAKPKRLRPAAPISLGDWATFDEERFQVIGWLRYKGWDDEDRWHWDEWLLSSEAGGYRWLSLDDDGIFGLYSKRSVPAPVNYRSNRIPISDKKWVPVLERGSAQILGIAGELTWEARVKDKFQYIEGHNLKHKYTVELHKDEIELSEGTVLTESAVWEAFANKEMLATLEAAASHQRFFQLLMGILIAFIFIALLTIGGLGVLGGRSLMRENVTVSAAQVSQETETFVVERAGRVHEISLKSSKLPINSWVVVDVALIDASGNEFYLFSSEFWDEAGTDSDGYWRESDLSESKVFRIDDPGEYTLEVSYDEADNINDVTITADVKSGVWLSRYLIVFIIGCSFLAFACSLEVQGNAKRRYKF